MYMAGLPHFTQEQVRENVIRSGDFEILQAKKNRVCENVLEIGDFHIV